MAHSKTRGGTDLYVKDPGSGRSVRPTGGLPLVADMWDAQPMARATAGFRAIADRLTRDLLTYVGA